MNDVALYVIDATAFLLVFSLFFIYPFGLKKILKNKWVWLGLGIFYLTYIVLGRFMWYWFIDQRNFTNSANYNPDSDWMSNAFVLDICTMFSLLCPILIIIDFKERKLATALAPWFLAAGMGTLIVTFDPTMQGGRELKCSIFDFIFVGIADDRMFWMMHFLLFLFSVLLLLSGNVKKSHAYFSSFVWVFLYLPYVILITNLLHVPRHCAGMVDYDWYNPDGEWYCIYQIIPINNQPLLCVLTYIIATQIVGWFSYFIQYLHNLKWYQNDETIEFNVLNKIALKLKRT